MGWLLLPGDFGLLAFAQTILLVAGLVLQSGFPWSLAREVAKADESETHGLVRGTIIANLTLASLMGSVLLMLFALGPLRAGLETTTVAVVVALSFPFISFVAGIRGYAQGLERFDMVATLQVAEILFKALIGTALVLLGLGVAGAVAGFLLGGVLAATLGSRFLIHNNLQLRGRLDLPDMRKVAPIFGSLLGLSLLLNLDLAALKLLSNVRVLTGYYQAGVVLANAPFYLVSTAMVTVLFVQLAHFKSITSTRQAVGKTLTLAAALVFPFEVVLMILPGQALTLFFPESYAPGAPALRLLAIGNTLLIVVAILSAAFQAIGQGKIPARILLVVAFIEVMALAVIVPTWKTTGAASVFIAASSTALLLLGRVYLQKSGTETARRAASWLSRYGIAVGLGTGTGYLVSRVSSPVDLAVAAGVICYLLVLLPLRLVTLPALLKDRTALRAALQTAFRKATRP
jgi:O-antigen/teichoic acid export membrane protein